MSRVWMRTLTLAVAAIAGGIVPADALAARTPSWLPALHHAAAVAGVAATKFAACTPSTQASPNAGNTCAVARAAKLAHDWNVVAVKSLAAAKVGPCKSQLTALQQSGAIVLGLGRSFAAGTLVTPFSTLQPRGSVNAGAKRAVANWGAVARCLAKRGPVTG